MSGRSYAAQAEAAAAAEFRAELARVATPERIRALLNGRWLRVTDILAALGLDTSRAKSRHLAAALRDAGAERRKRSDTNVWTWSAADERPVRTEYKPRGLSLMPGRGEKRDCARYGGCVTALARALPYAEHGHCPSGCAHFVEPSRAAALVAAVADVGVMKRGAQWGAW